MEQTKFSIVKQLKLWMSWRIHLIDAYYGVGTWICLHKNKVKSLRGMDIIPEAIEDAKRNAKKMGFDNTHYEAGTAEEIIPRWYKEGYRAKCPDSRPSSLQSLDDKLLDTILTMLNKMVCNIMFQPWREI